MELYIINHRKKAEEKYVWNKNKQTINRIALMD